MAPSKNGPIERKIVGNNVSQPPRQSATQAVRNIIACLANAAVSQLLRRDGPGYTRRTVLNTVDLITVPV
jgi:hypothetical protein